MIYRRYRSGRSIRASAGVSLVSALFVVSSASAQDEAEPPVRAALESAATALQEGRPDDALFLLDEAESAEPDNPWVWHFRGVGQMQLRDWYASLASLDKARDLLHAHGDPDPQLYESIRRTRRRARREVFGVSLQMGLSYDSNVSFLGSGGAGLGLLAGRGDTEFASRFSLYYAPVADAIETLSFGIRVTDTWHFAIDEFDYQDYGLSIQYVRRLGDRWEAGFGYNYDISYLGNEPFLSQHGLVASLNYRPPTVGARLEPAETTLSYRFDARDFLFDTTAAFDRDGFANSVGIEQRFSWRPIAEWDWRWDLYAGYTFESVATEGTEFNRLVHLFNLGFVVPLPSPILPERELTLRFNAGWELGDYRDDSLIDAGRDQRRDLITTLGFVLSQELADDPDLGELYLHGIVSWTDADSNVTTSDYTEPFTYDRWLVGFQLEWKY